MCWTTILMKIPFKTVLDLKILTIGQFATTLNLQSYKQWETRGTLVMMRGILVVLMTKLIIAGLKCGSKNKICAHICCGFQFLIVGVATALTAKIIGYIHQDVLSDLTPSTDRFYTPVHCHTAHIHYHNPNTVVPSGDTWQRITPYQKLTCKFTRIHFFKIAKYYQLVEPFSSNNMLAYRTLIYCIYMYICTHLY